VNFNSPNHAKEWDGSHSDDRQHDADLNRLANQEPRSWMECISVWMNSLKIFEKALAGVGAI
jgi:hypothetical protein